MHRNACIAVGLLASCAGVGGFYKELDGVFEGSPNDPAIHYAAVTDDVVAALNKKILGGSVELKRDKNTGYLRSVLDALDVPVESQIVAMAKTSAQQVIISPKNPRTLYFNDRVSVGHVQGGFIEIAVQDPRQGTIFYTLGDPPAFSSLGKPTFRRDDNCLQCHLSYSTMRVPGLILRSVYPTRDGSALAGADTYETDHRSPIEQRYGGWYVTGKSGPPRHLGNAFFSYPLKATTPAKGKILNSLPQPYLTRYSDVVALLVFDHQTHMTNLITRVGWEARLGKADRPETLDARMQNAAKEFVDYVLFVDEEPLGGPIRGSSGFAERFAEIGPKDGRGRSLRQLDLDSRLMRYPCSYMIYSEAFDSLPREAKDAIYRRLWEVLSGKVSGGKYTRLSAADRQAVIEILRETKRDLPVYFNNAPKDKAALLNQAAKLASDALPLNR